jgi:hypothetical protein
MLCHKQCLCFLLRSRRLLHHLVQKLFVFGSIRLRDPSGIFAFWCRLSFVSSSASITKLQLGEVISYKHPSEARVSECTAKLQLGEVIGYKHLSETRASECTAKLQLGKIILTNPSEARASEYYQT